MSAPVFAAGDGGDRQLAFLFRSWVPMRVFGQVQGPFVLGAHGGVEEGCVAQAHLRGDVPEQAIRACRETPALTRAVA